MIVTKEGPMWNPDKERLLHCFQCKMDFMSSIPAPTCKFCGNILYTVTKSAIDGTRRTGKQTKLVSYLLDEKK